MGGDTRIGQSEKMFRGHSRDFQGIKFPRLQVRQDSLDCSAYRLLSVKTEFGCPDFTGQPEKGPSRFADFSTQSVPIEIFDQSPASRTGLTFESQRVRQECPILDQDGTRLDCVWHLGPPRRLQWCIVRQQLAPTVACLGWTRSLSLIVLHGAVLTAFFVGRALAFPSSGRCNSRREGSTNNSYSSVLTG